MFIRIPRCSWMFLNFFNILDLCTLEYSWIEGSVLENIISAWLCIFPQVLAIPTANDFIIILYVWTSF